MLYADGEQVGGWIRGNGAHDIERRAEGVWHREAGRAAEVRPILHVVEQAQPAMEGPLGDWAAVRCVNCGKQVAQVHAATGSAYLSGVGGHAHVNTDNAMVTTGKHVLVLASGQDLVRLMASIPGACSYGEATPTRWLLEVPAGIDLPEELARLAKTASDTGRGGPPTAGSRVTIICDRCNEEAHWEFSRRTTWVRYEVVKIGAMASPGRA